MFTPPPSPLPPMRQVSPSSSGADPSPGTRTEQPCEDTHNLLPKQRLHSSIRWTIVLVPLALILLAASTRFRVHPAAFDLLSTGGCHQWAKMLDWSLHEPHKPTRKRMVKRSSSDRLSTNNAPVPAPTVPVDPALPTPFPQPFDTTLSANFTTTSCYDFFLNMTEGDAFRACRPFSLLLGTSHAFEQAQKNISLMNVDVWGTCNTDISQGQCDANMSWFASSLQSSCVTDLANQVEMAVTTLNALHTYDLMRNVGCTVDSATNSYCYVEAVANSDPSSFWFYRLALGDLLGSDITTSACNRCTSELMAAYAAALNSPNGTTLTGLAQTYNAAVDKLNSVCGPSYAKKAQVSNTASTAWMNAGVPTRGTLAALGVLVVFTGVLCGG